MTEIKLKNRSIWVKDRYEELTLNDVVFLTTPPVFCLEPNNTFELSLYYLTILSKTSMAELEGELEVDSFERCTEVINFLNTPPEFFEVPENQDFHFTCGFQNFKILGDFTKNSLGRYVMIENNILQKKEILENINEGGLDNIGLLIACLAIKELNEAGDVRYESFADLEYSEVLKRAKFFNDNLSYLTAVAIRNFFLRQLQTCIRNFVHSLNQAKYRSLYMNTIL